MNIMSTEKHGLEETPSRAPSRLLNDEEITDTEKKPMEKSSGTIGRIANNLKHVGLNDVDDSTVFYNLNKNKVGPLTPEAESRLVRKNFWCLLSQTWWIAFLIHLDKSTLSQASTMGIFEDVNMTKKEYNDLFVMFYVGYLIALWPGAWISQKIGQKHFIAGSLFLWAFLLGMHPLVKTGRQLMGLRFVLGMVGLFSLFTPTSSIDGYCSHLVQ